MKAYGNVFCHSDVCKADISRLSKKVRRINIMGSKVVEMGKALLISYLLTGIILAILSYFVLQYEMKEGIVNIVIVATYVIANFMGGFICGKRMKEKKFLWGLALGLLYAAILMVVSVALGNGSALADRSNLTMMMLCTGGGMLGGMLA